MNIVRWLRWPGFFECMLLLSVAFLIRTIGYGLYRVPTGSMETTMLIGEFFFADKFSLLFFGPQQGDIIVFNDPSYAYAPQPWLKFMQQYVWGPANWTKRVIGVPGDRIRGVIEHGRPVIYRNDKKVDESYLNEYPLIGVWAMDPKKLAGPHAVMEELENAWTFKAYDPSKSAEQQPWYCIDQACIMRGGNGAPLLKKPGQPLASNQQLLRQSGISYWDCSDQFYVELDSDEYWVMGDNRMNSFDSRAFGPLKREHIHGTIRFRVASFDVDASWLLVYLVLHPIDFFNSSRWNRWLQLVH